MCRWEIRWRRCSTWRAFPRRTAPHPNPLPASGARELLRRYALQSENLGRCAFTPPQQRRPPSPRLRGEGWGEGPERRTTQLQADAFTPPAARDRTARVARYEPRASWHFLQGKRPAAPKLSLLTNPAAKRATPHQRHPPNARCAFCGRYRRCSPTRTIFIVLVPPALPIGSPIVSTITSPGRTCPRSTSSSSAAMSTWSRSPVWSR